MRFRFQGVDFGGNGDLLVTGFEPGATELRTNDVARAQRDGVIPGRDLLGSSTWAFDLVTNRKDLAGALTSASALEAAWKNLRLRSNPFTTVPLSYEMGGRWRRVYGRPGQFLGPIGNVLALQGAGKITCDFRVLDPLHYDDAESSVRLSIVPATTGGLEAPLIGPLTTVRSSAPRAGIVSNSGDAPTPLKVQFNGPVSDPWVRSPNGWEVGLAGTLAYDQTVTVDPLEGTVTRQDGVLVAGMLSRKTRLSGSLLQPGTTELTFGGTDPTGTASAVLSWRNAYNSI